MKKSPWAVSNLGANPVGRPATSSGRDFINPVGSNAGDTSHTMPGYLWPIGTEGAFRSGRAKLHASPAVGLISFFAC